MSATMQGAFFQISVLFLASLAGGWAAFFFKTMPKAGLKSVLAFSGAYILGITALHLLGDVYGPEREARSTGLWILAGFFVQLLLDFLSQGIEHGHVHAHEDSRRFIAVQIMLGLSLHAFFEGLPLSGDAHLHEGHGHAGSASLLVGIVLHEMPASFALASLLLLSGFSRRWVWICLVLKASMAPLGLLMGRFMAFSEGQLATATAFVIGLFLHIATTILFEADSSKGHHRMSRERLAAIAAGVGLALLTT